VDIQPYVLRYWETEFDALAPGKSKSGQRVYTEQELGVIRRIKELLYEEGYTIAGAKKRLQAELEDGRSFAPPEAEGELFEGVGEDEPPVIALGNAAAEARGESPVEPSEAESESGGPPQEEPDAGSPSHQGGRARSGLPAWAAESEEAPAVAVESAVESEGADAASAAAIEVAAPSAEATASGGKQRGEGERAVEPRPSRRRKTAVGRPPAGAAAVDTALSKRVETLEHGLRRVLDQVRNLRALLQDPSGDR
jgi:DNA-binding transcriptional MerR regulator